MIWCVEDDASIRDIEVYALNSTGFAAEGFADGAVDLLTKLGCVDTLAFGCEETKEENIMSTAKALLTPEFPGYLKVELAVGRSFPAARQRALERLIPSAKGKNFEAFAPFYCEYGVNIHVGRNCFVNYNSVFLDVAPITLGDNVLVGPNVTLATPNHPFVAEERAYTDYPNGCHELEYAQPIAIGDHCWLCAGVTVCGGVTIGAGSIIAAGAVVTRDIPPNSIAAGVPAKVLRQIDGSDRLNVWETYMKNELPGAR